MTSAAVPSPTASQPAEHWRDALLPALANSQRFTEQFFERLRTAKLTFGDRVLCPFLRPFFLSLEDEQRVRIVAETIAALGERAPCSRSSVCALKRNAWRAYTVAMVSPARLRVSTLFFCLTP